MEELIIKRLAIESLLLFYEQGEYMGYSNSELSRITSCIDKVRAIQPYESSPRLQEAAECDAVEFGNFIGGRALPEYSKSTNQWRWWNNDKPGYETATTEQLYTLFKTRPVQTKQ